MLILGGNWFSSLLSLPAASGYVGEKLRRRVEKLGVLGAGLLGIVFALSFCPVSAALFFGSLLPLVIKFESGFLLPLVYGTATGLPVLFFASMLAFAAGKIGKVYSKITIFEKWAQKITGIIFMLIGIYFTLTIVWRI